MGCRILIGHEAGTDDEKAALFCSTTGLAFGPIFDSLDEAEAFLDFEEADPRSLSPADLYARHVRFVEAQACDFCGGWQGKDSFCARGSCMRIHCASPKCADHAPEVPF